MPILSEHPIIAHAQQIRQAMLERDAALLNKITREYLQAYKALKADIAALKTAIAGMQPEKGQLLQLAATRNLLEGVKAEVGKFAALLGDDIQAAVLAEIQQAGLDAYGLVQAALPGLEPVELAVGWSRLAPEQVYTMFGFADPAGPLYSNIRNAFGQAVADTTRDALLQGYIKGMHSTAIARLIQKATGQGLTWALSTARTATIWSYRAATLANYAANSQVVQGWIWWSARDDRTCMSCIAMHGSIHPADEMLADHHDGRCSALPLLATWDELGITGVPETPLTVQRGEDWFKTLPEAKQREMMGPAKFKAWQAGAFTFDQLTRPYTSPVYGKMLREASLKEILGDKAALYYAK
jgi:SPP1 gp7 family putative phage head morphogenesis protein